VRTEVLEILAETRTTSILVTHDQEEALSVGDRVAVMIEGRVLQEDSPAEIYRRPSSLEVARFVGDGQMLACRIEGGRAKFSLGETPAQLEDGEGWVLVRPEQIRLAEEGTTGVSGRIQQLHFYGHDLLEVVVLDSGERFDIRLPAGKEGEVGQRVRRSMPSRFPRIIIEVAIPWASMANSLTASTPRTPLGGRPERWSRNAA
jgi:iron(III) transport system ATP-binding protein